MSVAFVREESAEAAQEVSLPLRAISAHPNLVTRSGLLALERALADSQQALKAAQAIADPNDRRRALELAARDVRYFAERVASAVSQPEPGHAVVVADRTAHRRNAACLIHRRSENGKVKPLAASNIAVEDLADMKAEIHISRRLLFS
jgi:hypothetical protein